MHRAFWSWVGWLCCPFLINSTLWWCQWSAVHEDFCKSVIYQSPLWKSKIAVWQETIHIRGTNCCQYVYYITVLHLHLQSYMLMTVLSSSVLKTFHVKFAVHPWQVQSGLQASLASLTIPLIIHPSNPYPSGVLCSQVTLSIHSYMIHGPCQCHDPCLCSKWTPNDSQGPKEFCSFGENIASAIDSLYERLPIMCLSAFWYD